MANLVKGQQEKICPLLSFTEDDTTSCQEEQCAWYISSVNKCAIWKLVNDKGKASH